MTRASELRARFLDLHTNPPSEPTPGILVMPNAWDCGSAKIIVQTGALALATTSSGHAAALGKLDQQVTIEELFDHVAEMTAAVDVPVSVDSEDCFGVDAEGVAATASRIASTDAAGFSIEDFDPRTNTIRPIDVAAARVAAARSAGRDLVLTARAENLLYGVDDLDDTITRLIAYRDAGADVVYAPGLRSAADIERVVTSVACPVNVLAVPGTPPIPELAELGVARISVGGLFAWAAYGALATATREVLATGTSDYVAGILPGAVRDAAFS